MEVYMKPNIGENIRKLRNEKQVTQEQLAEHLSISYQAVSKWENNMTTPDIYLLPEIAGYFEVPIDELFKVNMKFYKNKALRLLAVYERTGKKEDYEKADEEFERLLANNQADGEDILRYGILNEYHSDSLSKKSEKLLKEAISLGVEGAKGQLIGLLSKRSRNEENIVRHEEMLKNNPDIILNWGLLVSSYKCAKMYEKALETAEKGLKKFPNDWGLLNQFGDICRDLKRYDTAFVYWNKSNEQDSKWLDNYYSMAFAYSELEEYGKALKMWDKILSSLEEMGAYESTDWPKREIVKLQSIIEYN